jgi:hypothetical protein
MRQASCQLSACFGQALMPDQHSPPLLKAHTLSDWELWACARQQIEQHGEAAATIAAMKVDKMLGLVDKA